MGVKHLFSHALAQGEHKRSHTDISRAPTWDAERDTDSKGAGEGWWSKGFSLSSYIVEPLLPVCRTERERGEKSPQISARNLWWFAVANQQIHAAGPRPEWACSLFPCRLSYCAQDLVSTIIVSDILSKKSGHHSNTWITWCCTPDTNQSWKHLCKETGSWKTADGGCLLRLGRCSLTTKTGIVPYNLLIWLSLHTILFSVSLQVKENKKGQRFCAEKSDKQQSTSGM